MSLLWQIYHHITSGHLRREKGKRVRKVPPAKAKNDLSPEAMSYIQSTYYSKPVIIHPIPHFQSNFTYSFNIMYFIFSVPSQDWLWYQFLTWFSWIKIFGFEAELRLVFNYHKISSVEGYPSEVFIKKHFLAPSGVTIWTPT